MLIRQRAPVFVCMQIFSRLAAKHTIPTTQMAAKMALIGASLSKHESMCSKTIHSSEHFFLITIDCLLY